MRHAACCIRAGGVRACACVRVAKKTSERASELTPLLTCLLACLLAGEVALLAALVADLAEEHGGEEANVPGDEVQPELVVDGGALGEVGHVLADGVDEGGWV